MFVPDPETSGEETKQVRTQISKASRFPLGSSRHCIRPSAPRPPTPSPTTPESADPTLNHQIYLFTLVCALRQLPSPKQHIPSIHTSFPSTDTTQRLMVMKLDPTADLTRKMKTWTSRFWFRLVFGLQSGWYICGFICGYDVRKVGCCVMLLCLCSST